jgi:PKD repeat protein
MLRCGLCVLVLLAFGVVVALPSSASAADVPIASFTFTPTSPLVGQTITFDGSSSHDPDGDAIASYSWSFGDGDTQSTTSPTTTHAYTGHGQFTVTLTVTDSTGNPSAASTKTVTVQTVDTPPLAAFSHSKHPTVGSPVTFNASASSDPDGDTIIGYDWNFGDGTVQNTTAPSTTHTYSTAGSRTVTLVVIDSRHTASSPTTHTVKVKSASTYKVPGVPQASFTFQPARPRRGQLVSFNASSSSGGGRRIKKYLWSFGDGSAQSTTSSITFHRFAHRGTFTVQLVVEVGHHTFSAVASKRITVTGHPHISRLRVAVCVARTRRCRRRGVTVRFRLSDTDSVTISIRRRGHRRTLDRVVVSGHAGGNTFRLRFVGRRHVHYVLKAKAAGGNAAHARFAWRRR